MNLLNLVNDSSSNLEHVMQMVRHFFPYAQKQLGFHKPVMISFQSDEENANKLLGKTGYYNPDDFSIGIYVDGRHPKDLLRSLSHELVHHTQNCNGDFKKAGEPKMSLKEWKDNELNTLLMEKWGYGKKAKTLSEEDEENIRNLTEIAPTDSVGYRDEDKPKKPEEEEELEEVSYRKEQQRPSKPEEEEDAGSEFLKSKRHDPETAAPFKGTKTKRGAAKYQHGKEKTVGAEIEDLDEGTSEKAQDKCGQEAKNQQEYDECMQFSRSGQAWQESQELEEGCPPEGHEVGGEAIDISGPGMEVHVDDISELSPEEAFAAGMAAAKDAIDQAIGGEGPPEGGGALQEDFANPFGPMTDEPSLDPCQDSPDPECENSLEYQRWARERDLPPGEASTERSAAWHRRQGRRAGGGGSGGMRTSMAPAQEGTAKVSFTIDEARNVARRIFERIKETK